MNTTGTAPRGRRPARLLTVALLSTLVTPLVAAPATAQESATGPEGQRLTVSKVTELSPEGESVSVRGTGYDESKGIYVAYCVDNGPGELPTPCGGGADTTGSLGASHWISSDPPDYGEGLAEPYQDGGSFALTLQLTRHIGDVDCTIRTCAVVTRADHTRGADRSQDVRVPVSFATGTPQDSGAGPPAEQPGAPSTPGTTGGVISAGDTPPPAADPAPDTAALDRTSSSATATQWWLASAGAVLLLAAAVATARLVRRRRRP